VRFLLWAILWGVHLFCASFLQALCC
jgi:hypothetical protein